MLRAPSRAVRELGRTVHRARARRPASTSSSTPTTLSSTRASSDHVPRRARQEHGVRRQRETLVRCDAVTVTTAPLAERAAGLHGRVLIEPNTVSSRMLRTRGHGARALRRARPRRGRLHRVSERHVDPRRRLPRGGGRRALGSRHAPVRPLHGDRPAPARLALRPVRQARRAHLEGPRGKRSPTSSPASASISLPSSAETASPSARARSSTWRQASCASRRSRALARTSPDRSSTGSTASSPTPPPNGVRHSRRWFARARRGRRVGHAAYEDVHLNHSTANLARATFETFRSITGGPADDRPPGASAAPDGAPGDRA